MGRVIVVPPQKNVKTHRSLVGNFLIEGPFMSLLVAILGTQAKTTWRNLQLHTLKSLVITLKWIKKQSAAIMYASSDRGKLRLEAMSDTAMDVSTEKTNVEEKILILLRSKNIIQERECPS